MHRGKSITEVERVATTAHITHSVHDIYMAAVFLLPTILAQGSGLVKLDCFFLFLDFKIEIVYKRTISFFLLKPFLTEGLG